MEFGMRPPEINSGQMHAGPGSELMMAAATAWDALAANLCDAAAGYTSATGKLAKKWQGPEATALTQATIHYRGWLNTLAARARRTAIQAKAAASAYETTFQAVVPPQVIHANRVHRLSLASTNLLGQTSAEIADTESDYDKMWAQDTDAMYAYAAASADAAMVTPFPSPPPAATAPAHRGETVTKASGSWRVQAAPEVVSAGQQVLSAIPAALQEISASPLSTIEATLLPVTASLSKLSSLSAPLDSAIKHLNCLNKKAALRRLLPGPCGARGAAIVAGIGRGASVGTLTVPRAWTKASTTIGDTGQPPFGGRVGEPIRLVAQNEPSRQPSQRKPS
jgi:PPE-repeat protein